MRFGRAGKKEIEASLDWLTERPGEGKVEMHDDARPAELPADAASRRLRQDMEKIRQERGELLKRQRELDEEEEEILLNVIMEEVDPLCVKLGIPLERAIVLLQREAGRRGGPEGTVWKESAGDE